MTFTILAKVNKNIVSSLEESVTLKANENWAAKTINLPKYYQGQEIYCISCGVTVFLNCNTIICFTYSIGANLRNEGKITIGNDVYLVSDGVDVNGNYDITNTLTGEGSLTVTKIWADHFFSIFRVAVSGV